MKFYGKFEVTRTWEEGKKKKRIPSGNSMKIVWRTFRSHNIYFYFAFERENKQFENSRQTSSVIPKESRARAPFFRFHPAALLA